MKVKVGISNHHVHLTKEVYDLLFFQEPTKRNDVHQIGEYACNETVVLKGPKGEIQNVRLMGPFRNYNQVEISRNDAHVLGLNPPVRKSGDLTGSENITLVTSKGSITLKEVCIVAERHIHMPKDLAQELNLKDNQIVNVKVLGDKAALIEAHIKIKDNAYFELHIDFDDANALGLKNDDEVEIIL